MDRALQFVAGCVGREQRNKVAAPSTAGRRDRITRNTQYMHYTHNTHALHTHITHTPRKHTHYTQVCVDMGEPILDGPRVPTTLAPTANGNAVVEAPLKVAGQSWAMTCVSMGNPHAVTYSVDGKPIKVRVDGVRLDSVCSAFCV